MPEFMTGGFTGLRSVIQIDASDLKRIAGYLQRAALLSPQLMNAALDTAAEARLGALRKVTPSQERRDPRYPLKLVDSYVVLRRPNQREVATIEPRKFRFVTEGTAAHDFGPRFKKALWWPGIQGGRPVAHVYHPGTKPNDFPTRAEREYETAGGDLGVAVGISDVVVGVATGAKSMLAGAKGAGVSVFSALLPAALLGIIVAPFARLLEWAQEKKR